jgi:hypothetical protein
MEFEREVLASLSAAVLALVCAMFYSVVAIATANDYQHQNRPDATLCQEFSSQFAQHQAFNGSRVDRTGRIVFFGHSEAGSNDRKDEAPRLHPVARRCGGHTANHRACAAGQRLAAYR